MRSLFKLPAAHTLTVTPLHGAVVVRRLDGGLAAASVSSATVYGPYMIEREFEVIGRASGVIAEDDRSSVIDVVEVIPTTDQNDSSTIFNDGGVLKVSTAP